MVVALFATVALAMDTVNAQFREHVKSSRENCEKGKRDCQWGTTKHEL